MESPSRGQGVDYLQFLNFILNNTCHKIDIVQDHAGKYDIDHMGKRLPTLYRPNYFLLRKDDLLPVLCGLPGAEVWVFVLLLPTLSHLVPTLELFPPCCQS